MILPYSVREGHQASSRMSICHAVSASVVFNQSFLSNYKTLFFTLKILRN